MQATVGGLVIGVVAGTALGIVYGLLPTFSRLSEGLLMGLYSLPRVALAPLFMLWFGIGITSKVWLSVSLVLFVVLFNVRTGISLIDPKLVHTMRLMGGRRRDIVRRITLPSLVPWLLSSARVGIGLSLMAVVVGEMISSRHGVGNLIAAYSAQFDAEGVMATLTFLGVVALFMTKLLGWLERHLTRWAATGEPTRPS